MTEKQNFEIELQSLEDEARAAHTKESYRQVFNDKWNRIGISVVIKVDPEPDFIMEYMLCALPANSKADINHLENVIRIAKLLITNDYSMLHRDDGWIICEKCVKRNKVNFETEFLISIVDEFEKSIYE